MYEEEDIIILKEKSYIITSDKNIEYKIIFSIDNYNVIKFDIYSTKIIPTKNFVLSCTLEGLIKNRFFKIFVDADEVFRELETKIEDSSIIEEKNMIYLDIPIGLNIIKNIILEIHPIEKTKEDEIEILNNKINNLTNYNNELHNKLKDIEKELRDTKDNLKNNEKELNIKI